MNPLRSDPTRTTMMRKAFYMEMRKRFRVLWGWVDENLPEQPFVELFMSQVEKQIDIHILALDHTGRPWTDHWIRKAYLHGASRAYSEVNQEHLSENLNWFLGGKNQFLRQLAGPSPVARLTLNAKSRLQLLLTRTFEELKGVSATLAQKMARTLSQGLARGETREQLLRRLNFEISDILKRRVLTIARTEIVRANATGKLDAYADLGITEVEVEVEFVTAGDSRVCPICESLSGQIFTLEQIQDIIPVHPECRCEPRLVKRRPG